MTDPAPSDHDPGTAPVTALAVFIAFLRLGLTSFGGPVAHIGYFRDDFVRRRRWLDERAYADLVALCQFLPGPASSQVGIGIGLTKAGLPGALAAWVAFTTPSAIALCAFGYGVSSAGGIPAGALQGLKVVAVAVVAQAVWGMAGSLCTDGTRRTLAVLAAGVAVLVPSPATAVALIGAGAVAGRLLLKEAVPPPAARLGRRVPTGLAVACLALFFAGLALLPLLAHTHDTLALVDSFYRAGAMVFGGGHVVLPLLQAEVVPPGWVGAEDFLAGYGAAQAVPGPLFTFAAYLGSVMSGPPGGVHGALVCLLAIFAPSFLLVFGTLPFWDSLRGMPSARTALAGINAVVVGLLLAALYDPVWRGGILTPADFALALLAFTALTVWRIPVWLVVILCALGGLASAWFPI